MPSSTAHRPARSGLKRRPLVEAKIRRGAAAQGGHVALVTPARDHHGAPGARSQSLRTLIREIKSTLTGVSVRGVPLLHQLVEVAVLGGGLIPVLDLFDLRLKGRLIEVVAAQIPLGDRLRLVLDDRSPAPSADRLVGDWSAPALRRLRPAEVLIHEQAAFTLHLLPVRKYRPRWRQDRVLFLACFAYGVS